MKNRITYLLLFLSLVLTGCFENEQDFFSCRDVFIVAEEMPEPIGGISSIQKSVEYPEQAREAGIEGRVTVQFIVNKKGEVEKARAIRGIGGGCDEAAVEAVRNARFEPARQGGKPVCVQFAVSINFRLQDQQ